MTHGDAEAARRQRDFYRTELMAHGEKLREAEDRLNSVTRRLNEVERQLTIQYGTVQSVPSDLPGR